MKRPSAVGPSAPGGRASLGAGHWSWGALLLLVAVVAAYWPIFHAGFIWDDDTFLTANPLIQAADGLKSFWFTARAVDYWPVTSSTLWVEWRLWGAHPLGYHATNLALHWAECLLLWAVLRRLGVPAALLGALLFAVHPVNVESVAWITQRKNVLALFFYLGSAWFFLAGDPPSRRAYAASLFAFLLALLSKASVVILPVALLGTLAWRRKVERKDVLRLAPYLLIAVALAAVNLWFQARLPAGPIRTVDVTQRILGAAAALWFYLGKAVLPIRLMFFYPQWTIQADRLLWWFPLAAALGVTAVLGLNRKQWSRRWLFGWGYFALALLPVLGFVDIYYQRFSLVADHYQHLAILAVVTLAATYWARWRSAARQPWLPFAVAAAGLAALTVVSRMQCAQYHDAETLYRATLALNPNAWLAENNLGLLLDQTGRPGEAVVHVQRALAINPQCAEAENNLGLFRAEAADLPAAIGHYERALQLTPSYAEARNNLANVLRRKGQLAAAIAQYELALRAAPGMPGIRLNLARTLAEYGLAQAEQGALNEAVDRLERAVAVQPDYVPAHANLGVALAQLGRYREARMHLEIAHRLAPADASIAANLQRLK
jgi:tetratricopeptide (TPR) repeat protein